MALSTTCSYSVRGEPFDETQDRLVEPSFPGKTLRRAQGERDDVNRDSKVLTTSFLGERSGRGVDTLGDCKDKP